MQATATTSQVLKRGRTGLVKSAVTPEQAFGFLTAGESVLWASLPVLQEASDSVRPNPSMHLTQLSQLWRAHC